MQYWKWSRRKYRIPRTHLLHTITYFGISTDFNNPIKACFLHKKWPVKIPTHKTQLVKNKFPIQKSDI